MSDSNGASGREEHGDRRGSFHRGNGRGDRNGGNNRGRNGGGRGFSGGDRRGAGTKQGASRRSDGTHRSASPARRVALDVIRAVDESDAYANLLLPVRIDRFELSGMDAALATELTYGTLRYSGFYDRVIAIASERDVADIDPAVRDALRLGIHQLLRTRVAPHAATHETVQQVDHYTRGRATGFANGVLRRASEASLDEWRARVAETAKNEDERLSLLASHPEWIVRALRQSLASEGRADELDALLDADNEPASIALAALPGLAPLMEDAPLALSPVGFRMQGGDPARRHDVQDGVVRVQDEGSQIAALALARVDAPAGPWLDMCAGPGGKAALLAAEATHRGEELVANEVVPHRAELVRDALRPFESGVRVTGDDGRDIGPAFPGRYARVLLDAPCTGLGALRRRPEARWRKRPADVGQLSKLQRELLDSAIDATMAGGVIAYVTCSPHVSETTAVVDRAVAQRDDVERIDTVEAIESFTLESIHAPEGRSRESVQLWPHRHGTDAMFIALLRKK